MLHVRRILYATDFSSYSNQAYFHAVALAENHGAGLDVVFVYVPGSGTPDGAAPDDAARRYWKSQLEQIHPLNPGIQVKHVLLEGDPAAEIVRHAREVNADLIVMGTHGRTGLERLLMGSVAEKVMRDAFCSVLVVKLPKGIPVTERADVAVAVSPA
jgi:nucleotide-binding universal stress UspA family protein